MSKTVTFTADVYPYCLGDVVVLNDDELKAVDKVAKARKSKVYTTGAQAEVESSAEADRQEANRAEQASSDAEAQAQADLEAAATERADEEGHTSPTGQVAPGTSGDTDLKTAAAAGKKKSGK